MEQDEWVDSAEAARRLGVGSGHVGWMGANGLLEVERRGRRRLVRRDSLEALESERHRWVTLVEAGRMIGVSSKTAQRLARQGHLRQRHGVGTRAPSIERSSVEAYVRGLRRRAGD